MILSHNFTTKYVIDSNSKISIVIACKYTIILLALRKISNFQNINFVTTSLLNYNLLVVIKEVLLHFTIIIN